MKKEELFDAIGQISSETIEKNVPCEKREKGYRLIGLHWWTRTAASLVVFAIACAGVFLCLRPGMSGKDTAMEEAVIEEAAADEAPADMGDAARNEAAAAAADTAVSDLKAETTAGSVSGAALPEAYDECEPKEEAEEAEMDLDLLIGDPQKETMDVLRVAYVKIGGYTAQYNGMDVLSSDMLAEYTGRALEDDKGWYRISGIDNLQFLIHECEGEYILWKFKCFAAGEYPYRDVMELIYGISSAEDLQKVSVTAANMDNTDAGKRIQKEIGEYEITDPADLRKLYDILTGLTCYGSDHWDQIDYGQSDDGMLRSVRLGRYLTIRLQNGMAIDSLKYTAVSGMFYEYEGVAYNRLSQQDRQTVETMLRIEDGET